MRSAWSIGIPHLTGEADKRRPAVIVSNDRVNVTAVRLGRGMVTIVPVTSSIARVFPFQVLLPANDVSIRVDSKAQAEQVRSVSVERIGQAIGRAPTHLMTQLDDALRLHLQLQAAPNHDLPQALMPQSRASTQAHRGRRGRKELPCLWLVQHL